MTPLDFFFLKLAITDSLVKLFLPTGCFLAPLIASHPYLTFTPRQSTFHAVSSRKPPEPPNQKPSLFI